MSCHGLVLISSCFGASEWCASCASWLGHVLDDLINMFSKELLKQIFKPTLHFEINSMKLFFRNGCTDSGNIEDDSRQISLDVNFVPFRKFRY